MRFKHMLIMFTVLLSALMLAACSSSAYHDGIYYAEMADFAESGWKETLEITVENGDLTNIDWDAVYKDNSIPIRKKQYSKSGLYGMLQGSANEEWYDQATAAEHFVLEKGVDALNITSDGHTDAVAGCTISVSEFDNLLRQCLEQAKK